MALGNVVVVPVVSPASASELCRLAAALAIPDSGTVVPLTVIGLDADDRRRQAADALVSDASAAARAVGANAEGVVATDRSVVEAVLRCMDVRTATLALMGWQGASTHRNVFGELIDSILGRSTIPLVVVRTRPVPFERIVLPVSQDHLLPGGGRGLRLAGEVARRLRPEGGPVTLLRTGEPSGSLPDEICALSDRVHHDRRRVDLAVGASAGSGDLVVVPVAPTASGLRAATTHMAWAAPDPWLAVAIDVGPPATAGGIADAVAEAGSLRAPPDASEEEESEGEYGIRVTAITPGERGGAPKGLTDTLRLVGTVGDPVSEDAPGGQRRWSLMVTVSAPTANVAVGAVLSAVHESEALRGAEITYDVDPG